MAGIGMHHPRSLASLTIVRSDCESTQSSFIRSIALFNVDRCPEYGVRFHMEHRAFDGDANRAEIIHGIAARVANNATLITLDLCETGHPLGLPATDNGPPPPTDLQILQRLRPDLDLMPFECGSDMLDETAAAFSIRRSGPGSSLLARARHAPEEAQILWLTYLWAFARASQRVAFSAAWQAWREIERARPLSF